MTPQIPCPVCNRLFDTSRSLGTHFRHRREAGDTPHITYEVSQEDARWDDLTEGTDYVRCLECGHRTVTLARHLKGGHGITAEMYREKHGADVPIRCEALKTKRSVAISNRPITRGEKKSVVCPGCGGTWEGSKYLGAVHELRCPTCREKDWVGKFEPEDYVTCRVCCYRAENLTSHLQNAHPDLVGHYWDTYPGAEVMSLRSNIRVKATLRGMRRSAAFRLRVSQGKTVHLPLAYLLRFRLKNGKVSLGRAVAGLGRGYNLIRRECIRQGVPYYNMLRSQERCLGLFERVLGAPYQREWSSDKYVNPLSGKRFKFDGCFESLKLLVEFHGYQHRVFPNRYNTSQEGFDRLRERDAEKARQVTTLGEYKILVVHDNEPWQDETHLRERLLEVGFPT